MNEGIVFEECNLSSEGTNENARIPIAGAGCAGQGAGCGANCYGIGCGAGC